MSEFTDDMLARYGWPDDDEFDEAKEVRCKFCGVRGLYFEERGCMRWILVDEDGNAHAPQCSGRTAAATDFPKLD